MIDKEKKISSGIHGLDEILNGGFIPKQSYLIQGGPGTGKSTIGYSFLEQGVKEGQTSLYISFGESSENTRSNAEKIGIDLSGVHFIDLNKDHNFAESMESYSVFPTAEVESDAIFTPIIEAVEMHKPDRVFLDSITMFQFLNEDQYQTRNLVLSFIKYICSNNATLLLTSELSEKSNEKEATFWVDGIITLTFSPEWRKINVTKYRGSNFRPGNHSFTITEEGLKVFTSLRPNEYNRKFLSTPVSSGLPELDKLLHGGIEQGTTTLVTDQVVWGKQTFVYSF